MKKKIVGILICTLLITTTLPVFGAHENKYLFNDYSMLNTDIKSSIKLNNNFEETKKYFENHKQIAHNFVPGEFIVKFKKEAQIDISKSIDGFTATGLPTVDSLNEKYNVSSIVKLFDFCKNLENTNPYIYNVYKFVVPRDSDILSIVNDYCKNQLVEYVEPNYILSLYETPNDPDYNKQWALHNTGQTGGTNDCDIDAPEAWDIETGDENIVIAVLDSGTDWDHPDIEANIWVNPGEDLNENGVVDPSDFNSIDDDGNGFVDDIRGWDFVDSTIPAYPGEDGTVRDNNPMDFHGHGTHCSGIVSAVTNNNIGVAGVCWNCSIMPVKLFFKASTQVGRGELDDVVEAVVYAADNGADVMSNSWGIEDPSNLLKDAMDYAYDQGVVLVAASGNSDVNQDFPPVAFENVISVAATNNDDQKADFSNFGSWIDVAAPGDLIYSTCFNDTYCLMSGTSMSTPCVAGLIGLVLSKNPSLSQEEVRTIIRSTTDDVNSDDYIGTGRINAYKALQRDSTPIVNLNSTLDDKIVSGEVLISGTAKGSTFVNYTVFYGVGTYPDEWMELYSSSTPVSDNILASWDTTSLLEDETYSVRLVVYDTVGQLSEDRAVVFVDNEPNPPGWELQWTKSYGGPRISQVQPIGDIDEDGINEVFVSSSYEFGHDGTCRILSYDKEQETYIEEYSWSMSGTNYWKHPHGVCVIDLGDDGDNEFCIGWGNIYGIGIYAYDWNGTVLSQLDRYSGTGFNSCFGGLCVCDYDDDGETELVFGNNPLDNPENKHVTALGWDNSEDKFIEEAFWTHTNHTDKIGAETVCGDTDNDGKSEVIVTISKWDSPSTAGTWALNWNDDTQEWEQEPISTDYSDVSLWGLAIGDLNRNGIPEIGVGTGYWYGGKSEAWLYEWDGSKYEVVWHKEFPGEKDVFNAIEIGDADNDGINEFCIGTDQVHIYQWDGIDYIEETNLVQRGHRLCSLNIGDCDSDGLNELKIGERDVPALDIGSEYIYKFIHPIEISISGGFGVKATIKNSGEVDLTDVKCNFTVTGGLFGLINKKSTKTISILKIGESETVSSGLFLGFGKIAITVDVSYDEWIPALKYTNGKQRFIFTSVVK